MPDYFSAIRIIAEERIIEAQKRGEFENLPGEGKPLVLEDESQIPPDMRMAFKILKNAGCLPEEVAIRKEIGRLADLLDTCRDEKSLVTAARKLRLALEKMKLGPARHAALEASDEYYQKALAKLARFSPASSSEK